MRKSKLYSLVGLIVPALLVSCGQNATPELFLFDHYDFSEFVPSTEVTKKLKKGLSEEKPILREVHDTILYETSDQSGAFRLMSRVQKTKDYLAFAYSSTFEIQRKEDDETIARMGFGLNGAYDEDSETMTFSDKSKDILAAPYSLKATDLFLEDFSSLILGLKDESAEYDEGGVHYKVGDAGYERLGVEWYRLTGNEEGLLFSEGNYTLYISKSTGLARVYSGTFASKYQYGDSSFTWFRYYVFWYELPISGIHSTSQEIRDPNSINGYSVGPNGFDISPTYEISKLIYAANVRLGKTNKFTEDTALTSLYDGAVICDREGKVVFTSSINDGIIGRMGKAPLSVKQFLEMV